MFKTGTLDMFDCTEVTEDQMADDGRANDRSANDRGRKGKEKRIR
jgi:hypothetical protein